MRQPVRISLVIAILLVAAIGISGCGSIRAGAMIRDAQKRPEELAAQVTETSQTLVAEGQVVFTRIYRPLGSHDPLPGIVLVHGAVEHGAFDRRMVALAQAIAIRGATVAMPHLPSLAMLRLDARDPDRLATVADWLITRGDLVKGQRVAFVGISVGGSYALLAATRPMVRERVSTVLTLGAYADLDRLVRRWMTQPAATPELKDPWARGRRLVLLGNASVLVSGDDLEPVRRTLQALLERSELPPRPQEMGAAGRRVLQVASSENAVDPALAEEMLRPMSEQLASLSPATTRSAPAAPVYLLHGKDDPVVPVTDLDELAQALAAAGTPVRTHETDLFSHVAAMKDVSFFRAWPMLRFVAAAMERAGL